MGIPIDISAVGKRQEEAKVSVNKSRGRLEELNANQKRAKRVKI